MRQRLSSLTEQLTSLSAETETTKDWLCLSGCQLIIKIGYVFQDVSVDFKDWLCFSGCQLIIKIGCFFQDVSVDYKD